MNRMWTLVASLEVVCFTVLGSAEDSPSSTLFLIAAPDVLHAGTNTSLALTVFSDFPGRVTAEVAHRDSRVSQTQDFRGGLTSVLTLPPSSPLTLTVSGYRGETLVFTGSTTVGFSLRSVSSFIQTDRSHYEPGDTVRVRIASVQLDNRPYDGVLHFTALHPSGNVAESWASAGRQGIVLKDFSLPEAAPVGQWTIKTTMNGVTDESVFTVGHSERPQFDVLIKTPPQILAGDGVSGSLSVSRYDGKPLASEDRMLPVVAEITQTTSALTNESETLTFPAPEDGNVQIKFRLQDQVVSLSIRARFQSGEETLTVDADASPSGSYIQISPVNDSPALVSSRRQVVTAGTRNSSSLSLTPALSWSPEACVTVYCVLSDGEVISDSVHVPISQHSSLSLTWSGDRARPGRLVSLTLSALEPGAKVGVVVTGRHDDPPPRSDLDLKVEPKCDLRMLTNARLNPKNQPDGSETGISEDGVLTVQKYWSPWMNAAEPLLWLDTDVSGETWTSEDITVPDGVTSLRALALEMSENLGLIFTPVPSQLAVSKDFSLSLDVPPQLIRGEEIVLEVNVVNHLEEYIDVIVLIAQSETFEFVLSRRSNLSVINAQKLTLGSHRSAAARFPIRPLSLGDVEIAVDAVSAEASESLVRRITVKPEGVEQFSSQTLFLELDPARNFSSTPVSFSFPPDVVPGSQRAHVALVGDVLALSINNMGSLVQMPLGCGEQNMIHFAPSAYFLHYLNMSSNDDEEIRSTALSYLKDSYRKQLLYRRDDGSFSGFGSRDASGSTWLTAFVLRCFILAKPYMHIDQKVLDSARTWLIQRQGPDGEFSEAGRVIHTQMQEGIDRDSVALTAYVLVALLEDGTFAPAHVTLAQTYLENKVSGGGVSNYSLGLAAYALALTGSPVTVTVLDELNRRADDTDGVKMWSTSPGSSSHEQQWHSSQIEMVSYVLLAQLSRGGFVEGIALMKWLTRQLSSFGGFGTTQDTVVALQALVCYAVYSGADTIELNFNISAPSSSFTSLFHIDSTNYREHQSREVRSLKDSEAIPRTGMVIMDVCMLSGFALSPGAAASAELIRKVEIKPDKISLYLDSITKSQVCIQLPIVRKFKVARTQDAAVLVYDYYEPTRRATASYNSPELHAADSCFFCGEGCFDCFPGFTITVSSLQSQSAEGSAVKLAEGVLDSQKWKSCEEKEPKTQDRVIEGKK
ncbi:CD109 antigen-like [Salarias fasciatus]|uniref:CD109 antigen-like n=1 Tax=Salarias fasciatus TaxID=181472 RepID=UPI0011769F90|nr:CD109 antigen-like [Salarias fasciatus]